jgi:O-antigen/teichoic acid export membrane protein
VGLLRGAAFNLLGAAVPALLAVLTVPLVVGYLGQEDYGLLMLVTSIMGYFALIDINVTAASTKFVAQHHAQGAQRQMHQTVSFGLLIYVGLGLVELIWLRIVLGSVQALGVLAWLLGRMKLRWARPDGDTRRSMLSFSAFAFLSRFAALSYSHGDKLIIGAIVGAAPLTLFAVPAMLVNRVMALLFRLAAVLFPHASQLAAQNRMAELETAYFNAARYLSFLNGATALLLATLAPAILTVWMGPSFAATSAAILTLMALAQWSDSLTHVPSLVNDGLGHPRVTGLFALARALLGLGLIALGVSQAGIAGAAWAHLAASLLMGAAFVAFVHGRSLPFPLRRWLGQALLKPTLALLPGAAIGWLLRGWAGQGWLPLIAAAAAVALAYAAAGWWLVVTPEHRAALRARLARGGRSSS